MPGVLSNEIFDVIDVMAHCGGCNESVVSASVIIGVGVFMHANSSMLFLKNDVKNRFSSAGGVSGLSLSVVCCDTAFSSTATAKGRAGFPVCVGSVLTFFRRTAF